MTFNEVISEFEAQKNERGIANFKKLNSPLISFGLGLTQVRKIAKKVGKNHELGLELSNSDVWEAIQMAPMIMDAKLLSQEEIEREISKGYSWMITYIQAEYFCKSSLSTDLVEKWHSSKDKTKKKFAFLLLGNLAKANKKLSDDFFVPYFDQIEKELQAEENFVKDAMNLVLFTAGRRSKPLNKLALAVAKKVGPVAVDYGDNTCEAVDCVKHLSNENLQARLK